MQLKSFALEIEFMAPITRKFERFLETYRRPDGRRWGGQDLHDATRGVVTRSYVTNLRKGRIENPGYEKLAAIAKAMSFPPQLWFEEAHDFGARGQIEVADNVRTLSGRVNHLFEIIRDEKTAEPYTNIEVARMSLGELTEKEIEGIRTGSDPDPSINKVVALAYVFGVHPLYFLDRSRTPPIIDQDLLSIFQDETVSAIARKSLQLSDREKQAILGIIQQFEDVRDSNRDNRL